MTGATNQTIPVGAVKAGLDRHLPSVRTAVTPEDLLRFAPTSRKTLCFSKHLDAARTAIAPADLQAHPATEAKLERRDLIPLTDAMRPTEGVSALSEDQQLMEYAQKWVSQTFFGTMLKQMRNSPFKSELFSGGRGGDAFGGMYDQHLADRMARASGKKLAESIVRQLQRQKARAAGASNDFGAKESDSDFNHRQEYLPVPPGKTSSISIAA